MNENEIALLIGAAVTLLLAWRLPRAKLWIGAAFLSFAASALYWRFGLPYHPAFTLACDWLVCYAIYAFAREQWELRLFDIFRLSVLISLLKMSGLISAGDIYAVALEACNWAALLLIGGTAIMAGARDGNRTFGGGCNAVHRSLRALREARTSPPFFKANE